MSRLALRLYQEYSGLITNSLVQKPIISQYITFHSVVIVDLVICRTRVIISGRTMSLIQELQPARQAPGFSLGPNAPDVIPDGLRDTNIKIIEDPIHRLIAATSNILS